MSLQGGASVGTPGSWQKIWEEKVISLSICLYIHLLHTTETLTPLRLKWEIYFYKEVCSFVHWSSQLCLIMLPLLFVLRLYNSKYTSPWRLSSTPLSNSNIKFRKFSLFLAIQRSVAKLVAIQSLAIQLLYGVMTKSHVTGSQKNNIFMGFR